MNERVNPVDTHDWNMIPAELNATCKACGIELMPPFRGLNQLAVEVCTERATAILPHQQNTTQEKT